MCGCSIIRPTNRACFDRVSLPDAESREDPREHVFGSRLTGDLSKVSKCIMESDENDLLARALIEQVDRLGDFLSGSHK
jgi:hypothetical protein